MLHLNGSINNDNQNTRLKTHLWVAFCLSSRQFYSLDNFTSNFNAQGTPSHQRELNEFQISEQKSSPTYGRAAMDVDNMDYEQLIQLGERLGNVRHTPAQIVHVQFDDSKRLRRIKGGREKCPKLSFSLFYDRWRKGPLMRIYHPCRRANTYPRNELGVMDPLLRPRLPGNDRQKRTTKQRNVVSVWKSFKREKMSKGSCFFFLIPSITCSLCCNDAPGFPVYTSSTWTKLIDGSVAKTNAQFVRLLWH